MSKIIVLGVDGYIGYPLAQNLLSRGHRVVGVDAFYRRQNAKERGLESIIPIADGQTREWALQRIGDYEFYEFDIAKEYKELARVFQDFRPDGIINLAQQPSAAFSMIDPEHATWTMSNNINGCLNVLWCMRDYTPRSHVVTLGTLGEYGCPNMPIPEGFFEVEYEGMKDILPFPKQTGSVYHTSKAQTTDLAWFAARIWELRITDVMQGIVYGTRTDTTNHHPDLRTRFDVGECFGTMINRAVACAVMGHPIVPYGTGLQKRAYIQLRDSIRCLTLCVEKPPTNDDSIHGYRVINQFDSYYTCNEVAYRIQEICRERFNINVQVKHIANPRIEQEVHYYNPQHKKLYRMGWKPERTITDGIIEMIEDLLPLRDRLIQHLDKITPTILWRPDHVAIKEVK